MADKSKKIRLERFGDTGETWRETYKPGSPSDKPAYNPIKPPKES